MKKYISILCASFMAYTASAQITKESLNSLLQVPKQYFVVKATDSIKIDGKPDDQAWGKAPWSDQFIDIEGKSESKIPYQTRFKMLWDNNYLYVYVQVEDPDIWATYTQQDQSVYHDNAVEMFIDNDGDTQNYVEFQINAFATVWDLLMSKPYRNGGVPISTWDVKGLKKAVYVNGTVNHPGDKDQYWAAELAFPIRSVTTGNARIAPGTIWRMNFSRVAWDTEVKDGKYVTKKNEQGRALPEHYNVWTSQGAVNLHFPERFGYVQFVDQLPAQSMMSPENEAMKLVLWKYFYLQQDYKAKNKKYAATVDELSKAYPDISLSKDPAIQFYGSVNQMWIQSPTLSAGGSFAIDQDGKFYDQRPQPARGGNRN